MSTARIRTTDEHRIRLEADDFTCLDFEPAEAIELAGKLLKHAIVLLKHSPAARVAAGIPPVEAPGHPQGEDHGTT